MQDADTPSLDRRTKPDSRLTLLCVIICVGLLFLTGLWANMLNSARVGGKSYGQLSSLKGSFETGLVLDAKIRELRAQELSDTGEGRTRRIRALKNEINDGFTELVKRLEKAPLRTMAMDTQAAWNEYGRNLPREASAVPAVGEDSEYAALSSRMPELNQALKGETESLDKSSADAAGRKMITALIISALVIGLVLFAVWRILAGMKNMLLRHSESARALADRDLTGEFAQKAESSDELGTSLDTIALNFRSVLDKNRSALKELVRISRTIAEISARVVQASETKEKRISETSAAILEINASVKGVAQGVDSLSLSASENSSSILEMAASVEEVALNVENLSRTVDDVSSSIVQMTAAIKQIGNSVTSLIDASSVTASSVMEMDSSIRQVEKNATDTATISDAVMRDAEMGRASVEATIKGMHEIKRASGITSEVIVTLSERANDIGAILSVIDEVAEQTNLLALNAAIIAAQAGEHGKGFAVVADEIKELADRTSSSTREIALLIKGVQEETRRAVDAINQAEKSIADGEHLSQKSGDALNKIVEGVKKAAEQVGEIAHASVEQAKGSQMIRDAVEQVTDMIMQISNATQEQGKGSELIMTAVERMKSLTTQVRSSTREQSKVGTVIAESTENITGMIHQIKRACDEQARGSEQIVHAIEDIQKSADDNIESVAVLDDAFSGLSRQIEALDKEVRRFRLDVKAG